MKNGLKKVGLFSLLALSNFSVAGEWPTKWNCKVTEAIGYWNSFAPPKVGDRLTLDLNALPPDKLAFSNGQRHLWLEKPLRIVDNGGAHYDGVRLVSEGLTIDIFNAGAFFGVKHATMWISADQGEQTIVNHLAHFLLNCEAEKN